MYQVTNQNQPCKVSNLLLVCVCLGDGGMGMGYDSENPRQYRGTYLRAVSDEVTFGEA